MHQDKSHNLHDFMRQQRRMLEDYQYIRENMDDNRVMLEIKEKKTGQSYYVIGYQEHTRSLREVR